MLERQVRMTLTLGQICYLAAALDRALEVERDFTYRQHYAALDQIMRGKIVENQPG